MDKLGLSFELPVGLTVDGKSLKDVELVDANGVAEKVILRKLQDKPYTWQGNVIAVSVQNIGGIGISADARKSFMQDGSVTIPDVVKDLTLADVNTLIVEIHRRIWQSFIPKQEVVCKYCGKKLVMDIDLNKIDFTDESKELMESAPSYDNIVVTLPVGLKIPSSKLTEKPAYLGVDEKVYNKFTFRPPLLSDAIRHEKNFSDSISFWRMVTMDCLVSISSVDENGVEDQLPDEFKTWYNLKIFNELLMRQDLHQIRKALFEYLPTLPFVYYEVCGCDQNQNIPVTMDASSFFSE